MNIPVYPALAGLGKDASARYGMYDLWIFLHGLINEEDNPEFAMMWHISTGWFTDCSYDWSYYEVARLSLQRNTS